ncbi:hypothetical protein M0811_10031 [Anaeramoeba ignava]|uniref:Uncharacterized protein n=1 Tax=Anaeramoeba ignava TaxID=1746090 RepID=A0A9Q0R910_ANAIG|nr:hypothetical protein M0811_10031 [Anaeramoeba ignava]
MKQYLSFWGIRRSFCLVSMNIIHYRMFWNKFSQKMSFKKFFFSYYFQFNELFFKFPKCKKQRNQNKMLICKWNVNELIENNKISILSSGKNRTLVEIIPIRV